MNNYLSPDNFCLRPRIKLKVDFAKKHYGDYIFEMAVVNFVDENYKGLILSLNEILSTDPVSSSRIRKIISDLKSLATFMCLGELETEVRDYEKNFNPNNIDIAELNKFIINIFGYLEDIYEECKKIYPELIKKKEKENEKKKEKEKEKERIGKANEEELNKNENECKPII